MSDKFTVVGSIGADPEQRTAKNGEPFVTFSVASNTRRRDDDGNWVDTGISWFDVTAFGALARHSGDALHRGDRVIVLGDLTVAQYTTASGGSGRAVKIKATAIGHDLTVGGPRTSRARPAEQGQARPGDGVSSAPQVDHSWEWAPVALGEPESATAPTVGAEAAEPEWMTTPF